MSFILPLPPAKKKKKAYCIKWNWKFLHIKKFNFIFTWNSLNPQTLAIESLLMASTYKPAQHTHARVVEHLCMALIAECTRDLKKKKSLQQNNCDVT